MTPALPRSLYGDEPALAVTVSTTSAVQLPGAERTAQAAGQGFEALYEQTSQKVLRDTASETFDAIDMLSGRDDRPLPARRRRRLSAQPARPGAPPDRAARQGRRRPRGGLRRDPAAGTPTSSRARVNGSFARRRRRSRALDRRLLDRSRAIPGRRPPLHDDRVRPHRARERLGRHRPRPRLVSLRARQPGRRRQGPRPTSPGLDPDVLYEGRDLPVTTDFRAVFCELAGKHLGIKEDGSALPRLDRQTSAAGDDVGPHP